MSHSTRIKAKSLLINIGVLACTCIIIVILCEVGLRVLNIQPMSIKDRHIHQPSKIPGLVYEFIPGIHSKGFGWESITINDLGFRSSEMDPSKPAIVVVGDSFAFGYGVNDDETNPAKLQGKLSGYNIVNAGVNGYNIEQEAIQYKARLRAMKPVLTIVEFVFNDADPKGHFDSGGIVRVGTLTPMQQKEAIAQSITRPGLFNFPGKAFLQEHSAIFNFVERATKGLPFRKSLDDLHQETFGKEKQEFYKKWFLQLNASIATGKKLFVIWPEANWHDESRAFLRQLAQSHGFTVLDLYDTFGNGYKPLLWDYHPNPASQQKAANAILKTIEQQDLLPQN